MIPITILPMTDRRDRNEAPADLPEASSLDRIYKYIYIYIVKGGRLKPVRWVGSSLKDVRSFPRAVRGDVGAALFAAQKGETDPSAKPLRGFGGPGVMEIVTSHIGDTWRSVYTTRIQEAVYVLHAFQKKSKTGIATPKKEIDLVRRRLAEAEKDHRERQS